MNEISDKFIREVDQIPDRHNAEITLRYMKVAYGREDLELLAQGVDITQFKFDFKGNYIGLRQEQTTLDRIYTSLRKAKSYFT